MTASQSTSENQCITHLASRDVTLSVSNPIPRLLIKSAILMPSAKKDDVNIVQIESEGYNKEKVLFSLMYQIILENIFNEHDAREDECKHFYIHR